MLKYVMKKLVFTVLVLFGAATISFILLHAIPGDTAQALAGPQAAAEDVENLRRALNLDAPYGEQYLNYMKNLLKGDLGHSYRNNKPVMEIVAAAWPATLKLAACSMLVAVLIGLPLGIFAAVKRGSIGDTIAMIVSFIGVSMPSFWLALLLIMLFSVKLEWLPFTGSPARKALSCLPSRWDPAPRPTSPG